MFGKRGVHSKGQEGLSVTSLLVIILGIIVVVVLIIGFTQGFDFIFGKFKILPGQNLQAVAESCKASADLGLKIDYCTQFKKITVDGNTEYVNCEDPRLQLTKTLTGGCATGDNSPVLIKCIELAKDKSYNNKAYINHVLIEPKIDYKKTDTEIQTTAETYCKKLTFPTS